MTITKTLTCLTALLFLFSLTAQAQVRGEMPNPEDAPATWSQFIGTQLAQSLASPSEEVRTIALQQIAYFARYHGELDLTPAVPALHAVYEEDPAEACRLAAVAGLSAIGDDAELWRLKEAVQKESSVRVQLSTLAALYDRYGPAIFERDYATARLARKVMDHYNGAHVIVSKPVLASGQ